jgi:hypothetical protein
VAALWLVWGSLFATLVVDAVALWTAVRGWRSRSWAACRRAAIVCVTLVVVQILLAGGGYLTAAAMSFRAVAAAAPSEKAVLLSVGLSCALQLAALGVVGLLVPVLGASAMFLRGLRLPRDPR